MILTGMGGVMGEAAMLLQLSTCQGINHSTIAPHSLSIMRSGTSCESRIVKLMALKPAQQVDFRLLATSPWSTKLSRCDRWRATAILQKP